MMASRVREMSPIDTHPRTGQIQRRFFFFSAQNCSQITFEWDLAEMNSFSDMGFVILISECFLGGKIISSAKHLSNKILYMLVLQECKHD